MRRPALLALILIPLGLFITATTVAAGVLVVAVLAMEGSRGTRIAMKHGSELYYTSNVDEEEAMRLAEFLESDSETGEAPTHAVTYQIDRDGERYIFRMCTREDRIDDDSVQVMMKIYTALMSHSVFNGAPVDGHLCDRQLRTVHVVPFDIEYFDAIVEGEEIWNAQQSTISDSGP